MDLETVVDAGSVEEPVLLGAEGEAEAELETPVEGAEAEAAAAPAANPDPVMDGRKLNGEVRAAVKQLAEAHPELKDKLNTLRDDYGRYQAVKEVAPGGVAEIRAWKTAIEANGGLDGIASSQTQIAEMQATDALLMAGDASFLDALPKEFAEGLAKIAPAYLDRLEKSSPEAYQAALSPHFSRALAATGLDGVLQQMYADAGDNAAVKASVKAIFDWFQKQTSTAGAKPGPDPLAAEKEKFQKERTSFEQQKETEFWKGLEAPIATYEKSQFEKYLAPHLKALKLDDAAQKALLSDFKAELSKRGKTEAFAKQMKAYRAQKTGRDANRITSYVKQNIDVHAQKAVDAVVQARYGSFLAKAKPVQRAAPGKTAPSASAPARVPQKPPYSEWDMTRTTKEMIYRKQCYTTAGKLVTWAQQ